MEYVTTDYDGCEYITAGKRYDFERREGELCNITDDQGDGIFILVRGSCAHLNGHAWTVHTHTEGKTLAELDVKAGDVVECVEWIGSKYKTGDIRTILELWECGSIAGLWRIISRAADTPTLWRDMTDAEKGALLLAKHEGKAIEYMTTSADWVDMDGYTFHDGRAYRIKPTPKVDSVTMYANKTLKGFGLVRGPKTTHRITFTTIDGKPDTASIKMEEL